ncbi:alpha/beta hydrolase [Sphingomonas oligophenolica]|uniref:Alpha/beta hydrolase n=2 Tax=Sphingomonas oligophenolica TaxID=301154 RepID=A0A502CLM8_9SPHN|nr:alpha/beta hydrolase [Sphingomonas oligophenolica]
MTADPSLAVRRAIADDASFSTWRARDGWAHRRFDWPAATPRGRVLVLGGRGDIVEKYLEILGHLHAEGWSVTTFDWRGQGGSGRLSPNSRVGHAADFAIFVRDLADFWDEWTQQADGPAMLIAHSMGGHIALRALAERAIDPAAVVLVAPMVGIRSPIGAWAGAWLARIMARMGDPARAAWRVRPDQRSAGHRQRLLTHDVGRFEDEAWWYERKPDLLLGPPSWAWVAEAFRSGRALATDPRIATITVRILMLVPDADGLVDSRAAIRLAATLPDATLIRFGDEAAHELLRESDAVRDRVYAMIDSFLNRHA